MRSAFASSWWVKWRFAASHFTYSKDLKGSNHWHRWIDAIVDGSKTTAGFDYAAPLTETVQLGNVATRACRAPKPSVFTSRAAWALLPRQPEHFALPGEPSIFRL